MSPDSPLPERRGGQSGRTRSALAWTIVSNAWAAAAALVVVLDADPLYRAPVLLTFVLVCPGLAIVRLLDIPDMLAQLSLAVGLSLALAVLVPAILLYAGAWSPLGALIILIAITELAGILQFLVRPFRVSIPLP